MGSFPPEERWNPIAFRIDVHCRHSQYRQCGEKHKEIDPFDPVGPVDPVDYRPSREHGNATLRPTAAGNRKAHHAAGNRSTI